MSQARARRVVLVVGIVYLAFQVMNALWVGTSLPTSTIQRFDDSLIFDRMSQSSWWSSDLWSGLYPFTYPAVTKLIGTGRALYAVQVGAATLAWLWLGWEVSRSAKQPWLSIAGACWILGLSLASEVAVWHQVVMTESLSSTGLVSLVALALAVARTGSRTVAYLAIPLSILWMELRVSNLVLVLGFAIVTALRALWLRQARAWVLPALALAMVLSFVSLIQGSNQLALKWVVDTGISDPSTREFLAERGMPTSPAVLDLALEGEGYRDRVAADPRLADFRDWIEHDSMKAYGAWLVSEPDALTAESLRSIQASIFPEDTAQAMQAVLNLSSERIPGASAPRLPLAMSVGSVAWVRPHWALTLWSLYTLTAAAVALVLRPRSWDVRWLVGWFLLLFAPVHFLVTFFGDTADTSRHGLGASLQLHLGLVLLGLWALDVVLSGRPAAVVSWRSAEDFDLDAVESDVSPVG